MPHLRPTKSWTAATVLCRLQLTGRTLSKRSLYLSRPGMLGEEVCSIRVGDGPQSTSVGNTPEWIVQGCSEGRS